MQGYMFRSKLGALIFMGFILFAVFRMIGTQENGGEIATAGEKIAAQRETSETRQRSSIDDAGWQAKEMESEGWGDEVLPPS